MIIGAMNHPKEDVVKEIQWMAALGLEFIDLSLEPPAAASWRVKTKDIKKALDDHNMKVVGHTAYYLPFASPFEEIRKASVVECIRCLEKFAEVGAKWMNLHPDRNIPMHDRPFWIERNLVSLHEMHETSSKLGVGLMVENLPAAFNTVKELAELLDPVPDLGLHLDIGHANLHVERNTTEELVARFGKRIAHVHLHDNNGGGADLHLPLGAGRVDYVQHLRSLKKAGYDGTITLEVFAPDRSYLKHSRDVLRKTWDSIQ
ncbi:MAG: sugar phosphate isomerase/epimerase family protein [Phycisphaerae bacterium]